mmetsp:Transcript_21794/g.32595  ORF Transcript_21794/g.32595 Transcript_21794/m.32595 type:complete len:87 (+) Transcript_21794:117-377(+)
MSAIFDFSSLITVLLLIICTCAYLRELRPAIFDVTPEPGSTPPKQLHQQHTGMLGICWKFSRIGERLSPYISGALVIMAFHVLFLK